MTEVWQDIVTGFGLGFIAYAATNLDNLLFTCGLIAGGARRGSVAAGFAISGSLVILIASSFTVLSYLLPSAMLGYLGIVPITLGLRILFRRSAATKGASQSEAGAVSVAFLLAANSVDTVATFAPMFAESETVVRLALVVGFIASAVVLFSVVLRIAQRLSKLANRGPLVQSIAAVAMIFVGIYVLLNTGTDLEE
ncbi:MAG: cadmium resistance transporter [Woeseiaceae bacterium]